MPGDTKKKSPKHVNVAFGVLVERFMTNKSIYVTYGQASRNQSFSLRNGVECEVCPICKYGVFLFWNRSA